MDRQKQPKINKNRISNTNEVGAQIILKKFTKVLIKLSFPCHGHYNIIQVKDNTNVLIQMVTTGKLLKVSRVHTYTSRGKQIYFSEY